jgi:hypothetical protein
MLRNQLARLPRRLRTERLEERALLAGDVSVFKSGTTLVITGTNAANDVVVVGDAVPGSYHVFGIDADESGDDTLVNGELHDFTEGSLDFTGIRNIAVNLKGGDDLFILTDVAATDDPNRLNNVTIDFGSGDDYGGLGGPACSGELESDAISEAIADELANRLDTVAIYGALTALGGTGNDFFGERGVSVRRTQTINMGAGDDDVALMGEKEAIVGQTIVIHFGAGKADLEADGVELTGNLTVTAGNGINSMACVDIEADVDGNVVVALGAGQAMVEVYYAHVGKNLTITSGNASSRDALIDVDYVTVGRVTTIVTGAGSDEVEIYNLSTDVLSIVTGAGHDFVSIAVGNNNGPPPESTARVAVINTGSGDDDVHFGLLVAVEAAGVKFDYLTVLLCAGNDCLSIAGTRVEKLAVFNGGSGRDNYDDEGDNSFPADPFFIRVLFQTFEECTQMLPG